MHVPPRFRCDGPPDYNSQIETRLASSQTFERGPRSGRTGTQHHHPHGLWRQPIATGGLVSWARAGAAPICRLPARGQSTPTAATRAATPAIAPTTLDLSTTCSPGTPPRRLMAFLFQQAGMDDEVKSCVTWDSEVYTVRDSVWKKAGIAPRGRVPWLWSD